MPPIAILLINYGKYLVTRILRPDLKAGGIQPQEPQLIANEHPTQLKVTALLLTSQYSKGIM